MTQLTELTAARDLALGLAGGDVAMKLAGGEVFKQSAGRGVTFNVR